VRYGNKLSKIQYPYYPLRQSLTDTCSKQEFLKQHDLKADKPIILMTAGGVGASRIFKFVDRLVETDKYQLLVLCGNQQDILRRLRDRHQENSENLHLFEFRDDMQNFIAHSDLVIAKPGATTVIELIMFNKSVIFTKPLGVHEDGNLDYALDNLNATALPKIEADILPAVEDLLASKAEFDRNRSEKAEKARNSRKKVVDRSPEETKYMVEKIIETYQNQQFSKI
jgi:processive 1,2-diacylglycerol beta-glucosyltransferase